jgi:predicted ATPase/DNA-binding SARP family transcriptional activator
MAKLIELGSLDEFQGYNPAIDCRKRRGMSPRLALHLLGPPQLTIDKTSISFNRRKSLALMAYLSMERDQHRRESLSSLLWPDTDQSNAFKNLRQVLWEIQQILGDGWLVADRETVCLDDHADVWLDVREFNSLISQSNSQDDITLRRSLLADAAHLYRHHFLAGFSLKDAHPFNDWAFAESEGLRNKLANVLRRLSEDYLALGQSREAIPHARRLVSLDPLDESAHRQLMEVYLQAGQHTAALKQYQTCEQILRKELNLDPQPETRELYKKIRKGEIMPVPVEESTQPSIPQHNLPHQILTFIGRQKEQNEIFTLLEKKRLVTLVGAGGIGKTSLSLQVGKGLQNEYPNGIWFIALDSLSNPELVTQTAASIFNIREGGDRPLLGKLIDSLRAKTTLLIFDNCEHLLNACAELISALLTSCPDIKVLATSRESLGIQGEAVYTMPSLPLPEEEIQSMENLTEYASVQLFAERAVLAQPSFQLTGENIRTVVDICRKVDGIPLAIELAAARVNILQVDEISQQLQASFDLLASDSRTIMPRHQTLKASLDWSWGLLNESEQKFMCQLSVFAGGWTLESAQAVCDGDVLELTGTLVKKSLIMVDQETGQGTRYRFHEIVREYAHGKFHGSMDEDAIHDRHLKYFREFSKRSELELRGPSRVDWMERLNDERNNLRAALHRAEKTDLESGLNLAGSLRQYWESSDMHEGIGWCEKFLQKSNVYPLARARALLTYAWLLTWLQEFRRARAATQESLDLFRTERNKEGEVDALVLMGNMEQFTDDLEAANKMFDQALKLSEELNDPWRIGIVYYYRGWDNSDYGIKFANWDKAISLFRQVGDKVNLANLLGLTGQFRVMNGEIEMGEKYLDEALQLWEANKRANIWENPRIAKSLIALVRGEYEQARAILEEVLISAAQTGNRMSYLWGRARLGFVALHAGDLMEARQILMESAQNFNKDGYTIGSIFSLEGIAHFYATIGKNAHAARLIGFADATREKISDVRLPLEQADMDMSIAACIARMGEAAYTEAYTEGKKMTLDEAVTFALEEDRSVHPVARVHRKPDHAQ